MRVQDSQLAAGTSVVVGEDGTTGSPRCINNGRGHPLHAAGLVSPPPAGILMVVGEDTNNGRGAGRTMTGTD